MNAKTIILTITAAALIAAPGTILAQQGPGECDGTGGRGQHAERSEEHGGCETGAGRIFLPLLRSRRCGCFHRLDDTLPTDDR